MRRPGTRLAAVTNEREGNDKNARRQVSRRRWSVGGSDRRIRLETSERVFRTTFGRVFSYPFERCRAVVCGSASRVSRVRSDAADF